MTFHDNGDAFAFLANLMGGPVGDPVETCSIC